MKRKDVFFKKQASEQARKKGSKQVSERADEACCLPATFHHILFTVVKLNKMKKVDYHLLLLLWSMIDGSTVFYQYIYFRKK